jgi:hypothetical protein
MDMNAPTITDFLRHGGAKRLKGPLCMLFAEDLAEVDSSLRHHLGLGFKSTILLAPPQLTLPRDLEESVTRLSWNRFDHPFHDVVNQIIASAPPMWMYYGFNSEYLFYPFCETRFISEVTQFAQEERRSSILCYTIDLYTDDLELAPNGVSHGRAFLDARGYFANMREGKDGPKEHQLDIHGGLRWRFEDFIPAERRKLDRIALFRSQKGLTLNSDHTFNIQDYNTYSCPWHHNLTAVIASFRVSKALCTNPSSQFEIHNFMWEGSVAFDWSSQQLMQLGLMEPGQWF